MKKEMNAISFGTTIFCYLYARIFRMSKNEHFVISWFDVRFNISPTFTQRCVGVLDVVHSLLRTTSQ